MKTKLALLCSAFLLVTPTLAAAQTDRVIGNTANTPTGSLRPETVLVNRDGSAVASSAGSSANAYTLNTSGTSTPQTVSPGGGYFFNPAPTAGVTHTVTSTSTSGVQQTQVFTNTTPQCLSIGNGTVVSDVTSGATPVGSSTLAGGCTPGATTASGGSLGADYSANKPTLPNVGATSFGGATAFSAYVKLLTIPASLTRSGVAISADGGARLALIQHDGTAASGAQPAQATLRVLDPGAASLNQGGSITLDTDKGQVDVWGPSGTFVSARAY